MKMDSWRRNDSRSDARRDCDEKSFLNTNLDPVTADFKAWTPYSHTLCVKGALRASNAYVTPITTDEGAQGLEWRLIQPAVQKTFGRR